MNESNFILPVRLTTKIQSMNNEIGICILVKQLYLPFGFILLQKDGIILGMNRSFYYLIRFVETSDLSKISFNFFQNLTLFQKQVGKNIEDFIPILKYTRNQMDLNNCTQQSLFYLLNNKDPPQSNISISQYNQNTHSVFEITFKVITVEQNNKILYQYLEIIEFRVLESHQEIQQKLQSYDNQLNFTIKNSQENIQEAPNSLALEQEISANSDKKEEKQNQSSDSKRNMPKQYGNLKTSIFENITKVQSQQTIKINDKKQTFGLLSQKQSSNQNYMQLISSRRETSVPAQAGRQDFLSGEDLNNIMSTRDLRSARADSQQEIALIITPSSQAGKKKVEFDLNQNNFNDQIKGAEDLAQASNVGSSIFSKTSTYKIILSRKIKSKSMSCNLSYFFIIGFISLTLLLLVNYIVYDIDMRGIDDFSRSYQKISNPIIMYMKTLDTMRSISYYYLMKVNAPSIDKQNELQQMIITKIDQKNILIDYKRAYENLLVFDPNINLINKLQDLSVNTTQVMDTPDDNPGLYSKVINLFQALTQYYISSMFILTSIDIYRENFLWLSILNFKESILQFQQLIEDNMNNVLNQNQANNQFSLIIILISSIGLILVIFAVVIIQQIQKKKLLSLLGCFQPQELQNKVTKLQILIQEYQEQNQQTQIYNGTNNKTNKNQINQSQALSKTPRQDLQTNNKLFKNSNLQKRKRLQASFSEFQFFSFKDLILCLVIIIVLNIQPTLSIILFSPYINDQKWLIQQQVDIYALTRTVIQEASPQILNLEWYWRSLDPTQSNFLDLMKSQAQENLENLKKVEKLAQQNFVPNYNQKDYENFYKQMLIGNMCQTSQQYPQYFQTNFTIDQCNSFYQGILQKGFLITVKKIFNELESVVYIYKDLPLTPEGIAYSKDYYVKNLINGSSFTDLNNMLKFINQSLDSFRRYFIQTSNSYCENIQSVFFALFVLQIFLVCFVIIGVWILIQKKLKQEIQQIKDYFTLFNINLLSTNITLNKYFTNDIN